MLIASRGATSLRWLKCALCVSVCAATALSTSSFDRRSTVSIEAADGPVAPVLAPRSNTTPSRRIEMARQVVRGLEHDMVRLLDQVTLSTVSVLGCEAVAGDTLLTGAGSGVIVDHHGVHVVTNAHVVDGCKSVQVVTTDGRRLPVRVAFVDKKMDLALLRFSGATPTSRAIRLDPRIGEMVAEGTWVLAVGNPFMLGLDGRPVASLGIVSGTRSPRHGYSISGRSIQHDAEINPGNSGGPLWSLSGQLLGINGAIVMRSNMSSNNKPTGGPAYSGASFSVPVSAVRRFIEQVVPGVQSPRHPAASATRAEPSIDASTVQAWLGATYRTTYDERGDTMGAMFVEVKANSPLQGRVLHGDVIASIRTGGRSYMVRSAKDLERALSNHRARDVVTFEMIRGTQRTSLNVRIGW